MKKVTLDQLRNDPILDEAGYEPAESPFFKMGTWDVLARLVMWLLAISIVRAVVNLVFEIAQLMDWLNGGGVG
jgi:hypothetical protein